MNILFTAFVLCASISSVSSTCEELEQCYENFGTSVATLGEKAKNPEEVVDYFCQHPHLLTDCFSKYTGCPTYQNLANLMPKEGDIKSQMKILCQHKPEYYKAVKCDVKGFKTLSPSDLQKSIACGQKMLQSGNLQDPNQKCKLMDEQIRCSPLAKISVACTADFNIMLSNNGMKIPCLDIFRKLTYKGRLSSLLMQGNGRP